MVVDGHSVEELLKAFAEAERFKGKPSAIICKTFKGKDPDCSTRNERSGLWYEKWYTLIINKNTRTLGAGDYPALKLFFIFKSAPYEKDTFCFISRSEFVSRPRLALRVIWLIWQLSLTRRASRRARGARLKLLILHGTASSFWQFWQVFDVYWRTYSWN